MRPSSSCSFIATPVVLAFRRLDTLAILQDACNSHSGEAGKPLPARSEWLTRAGGFIPPNAPPFWSMTPAIPPFGVPRYVNLTFWGGVAAVPLTGGLCQKLTSAEDYDKRSPTNLPIESEP